MSRIDRKLNSIFGDKQKKDIENIRKMYIDLLGDRYKLESGLNREMDRFPDKEKSAVISTYSNGESQEELWRCLLRLTELIYDELDGYSIPISKEMILNYYDELK